MTRRTDRRLVIDPAPLIQEGSAEVTRRTDRRLVIDPAPLRPAKEPLRSLGDETPQKYPAREYVPCLRCKEHNIACQGPELRIGGHCSNCYEDGKSCEFEPCASDTALNTSSSPPNFQSQQEVSIIDGHRARETPDRLGGFPDEHSISGKARNKPWWKRLFFWKDRNAKRN